MIALRNAECCGPYAGGRVARSLGAALHFWRPHHIKCKITLTLLVVVHTSASAQQLAAVPLDSGTLVRFHASNTHWVRGRLLQAFRPTSSTLILCRYPAPPCAALSDPHVQAIPAGQVAHLDIAAGSHWVRGGLIGAGLGAAVGGFFIVLGDELCDTADCKTSSRRAALAPLGLGFGLGALFGSAAVRWRPAW